MKTETEIIIAPCANCGKEVVRYVSNSHNRVFCSAACMRDVKSPLSSCANCGKVIRVPERLKDKNNYCCPECKIDHVEGRQNAKDLLRSLQRQITSLNSTYLQLHKMIYNDKNNK